MSAFALNLAEYAKLAAYSAAAAAVDQLVVANVRQPAHELVPLLKLQREFRHERELVELRLTKMLLAIVGKEAQCA